MSDDRPAVHVMALHSLVSRVIRAVETVLPKDFRGKILIGQIDNGRIQHHDVTVEYRSSHPTRRT